MAQHRFISWGNYTGLLAITPPLHDLPRGLRKSFPKLNGDENQDLDDHIVVFIVYYGMLGVRYEDLSVCPFVESLQDVTTYYLYHFVARSIAN